jgi:hypothetical protein
MQYSDGLWAWCWDMIPRKFRDISVWHMSYHMSRLYRAFSPHKRSSLRECCHDMGFKSRDSFMYIILRTSHYDSVEI